MIEILLGGANGKMGKVIAGIVAEDPNTKIVAGLDINDTPYDDFPIFKSPNDINISADVIIDFSHPSLFDSLLDYACKNKIPTVLATTGLSEEQLKKLDTCKTEIAIFQSANMSIGINLLIDLVEKASRILEDNFDIEIIEKHHNQKIDAPSGTALVIADAIMNACNSPKEYVYDRHSVRRKRRKDEIGIHSVRGGTIVGEHEVIFAGKDEIFEIKHTAASKDVFAVGAVKAAKFLAGKQPGLYHMRDLVSEI